MGFSENKLRKKSIRVVRKIYEVAGERHTPRWLIFISDVLFAFTGLLLGFFIKYGTGFINSDKTQFIHSLIFILSVRVVFYALFKIYAHVIRYTSIVDLKRILITVSSGTAVVLAIVVGFKAFKGTTLIPISIIISEFFFTLYLIANSRLVIRHFFVLLNNLDTEGNKALIIGSGEIAVIVKEALDIDSKQKSKPIGFVDSQNAYVKKKLAGLKVFKFSNLETLINEKNVGQLILAKENITKEEKEIIASIAIEHDLKVLSALELWGASKRTGKVDVSEIDVDDLLDRAPISLKKEHIKEELNDKVVLITGAAGSIGSEIVKQVASYNPKKLILIDQAESPLYDIELELKENFNFTNYAVVLSDITHKSRIEKVFANFQPDYVYHAAAYKHVPMMENNPLEAFQNNVMGSKILADLSHKYVVEKFVMVSTDKAVNPTGIMGATKRIAEMYIQSLNSVSKTSYITTRFGNVLNSNGSVIPRFMKQIREGGPITVTHPDITRFFMTIAEACQLVLEASVMGKGGEVFLFDMGKSVRILELAKSLLQATGYREGKDIDIVFTGLRPGEKLYEELLLEAEEHKETHHPKIKIAQVCQNNYERVRCQLEKFKFPMESQNVTEVVRLMKELVPTYQSKNSVFERLDKKDKHAV